MDAQEFGEFETAKYVWISPKVGLVCAEPCPIANDNELNDLIKSRAIKDNDLILLVDRRWRFVRGKVEQE